jgi:pyruvate/2-oxoglutarate dehydrogenase complex dihydrolipoamide dehydrogenase (E3) component
VREQHPDVVVVSTGSVPAYAPFDIEYKDMVVPLEIILNGMASVRKFSVVIGGGASGCETALHMAESGSEVTLIEALPRIGSDLEAITKKLMTQNLKKHRIEILTETPVIRITKKGVWVVGRDHQVRLLETQRVVMAIGYRPDHHLFDEVKTPGCEVHQIGDCKEPRNAKDAIREGALLGRAI